MAFMVPEYYRGTFYTVENEHGELFSVPGDVVGAKPKLKDFEDYIEFGKPVEFEKSNGIFARLSAPGYMDATDWSGPFKTIAEAKKYIEDMYEVDPDTGDELEENPRLQRNPCVPKISPKQWKGYFAMQSEGWGPSANDGYNMQKYGITGEQYTSILRIAEGAAGMDAKSVTKGELVKLLKGEKVHMTRASPQEIDRVCRAFGSAQNPAQPANNLKARLLR